MARSHDSHLNSQVARSRRRPAVRTCAIDALESRRLLSGETLSTAIAPILANTANASSNSITLDQYFTNADMPGTLVTFKTSLGTITVSLTDAATPLTVANFLSYVSSGAYTDTIFHRSAFLTGSGTASPSNPTDIVQGGGYVVQGNNINHIPTNSPVDDEYTTELYGDIAGTLAMAKTSDANSATSEWYFNVHDNTSALDTPTTDPNGVTTSYTVFGTVLTGMNVIDEIASLPTFNVSSSLSTVPVVGLTAGEVTKHHPVTAKNLVYTDSVTSQPGVYYTVTSSNNALVTPKITDGVLSFTYASAISGTAQITVVAKSLDGTSASSTISVTVPDSATPSAGPVAGDVTPPNVVTGTTATFPVLTNGTDSVAALDPSTVTIVTEPADGTATVDTSTGDISYTPNAGYTGADSLTYTVADTAGVVSSAATVSLSVVPVPVTVTIGSAKARSLTFTEPSGVVGHLTVRGGTAVITFASDQVTTTTADDIVTASGAGATLSSVVINNSGAQASISLTSNGAVDLGAVTDARGISVLDAPDATLTGTSSFGSIDRLIAAGATDATLSLGSGTSTVLAIPAVTDTTVSETGAIASITSRQWVNDDGGFYSISTPRIGRLDVSGNMADVVNLSSTGNSLAVANVGQAAAAWTVAGSVGAATFGTPAAGWSLTATGRINRLNVAGNLANNVTAATIGTLSVTGTTTGATIATTAAVSATASGRQTQIGRLRLLGAVSTSTITAAGTIADISTGALTSTQITGDTIGSLRVTGAVSGLTLQTTAGASSTVQIGQLRFIGAVGASSVSTSGRIANITAASLTSTQIASATIGLVNIAGGATSATIQTSGAFSSRQLEIGRLRFGGAVATSLISAVGNIGPVSAASLTGSQIYAGVSSTVVQTPALPSSTTDFAANARVASVALGRGTSAFSNSLISADILGPLHLGQIVSANGGTQQGVAAHQISAITATLVPGGKIDAGPRQLKSATTLSAYETAKKLSLGDFVIDLL